MHARENFSAQSKNTKYFMRWFPSIILLPIILWLIFNRGTYTWIDNVDLVIHEAGHVFFMIFGKFIHTLGGTLMQVILPSIIVWHFWRNNYQTGVQVGLIWLGQNLINISVYAADARAKELPLLGGSIVYHDWEYILGTLNLLQFDITIGYLIFAASIIIFLITLLLPLIFQE